MSKKKKSKAKKSKAKNRLRKRDTTIEASFRGEVNTREQKIPDRKIYNRKAARAATRQKKFKGESDE